MTFLIGIDSGGTHIVGTAYTQDGQQLTQTTAGPGNIFLDQDKTMANLHTVIETLIDEVPGQTCTQILVGIAGVEITDNANQVASKLQADFSVATTVISDAQLALLNGLEGADGTLIIAGTGSIVYGRQHGQILRYGGWGQLLGDTGSAYKITEAAMKVALASHDQGNNSPLQALLCQLLKADSMPAAARNYYQLSREAIAAFATKIAAAADAGDSAATTVISAAAEALGREGAGLLNRYRQPTPLALALSGSVLTHNEAFRATLVATVAKHFPDIQPVVVTTNNSRGVVFWHRWQG